MNLSITNECNRRCEYCFQKSWYLAKEENDIKEMSLDTVEKILDMMGEQDSHLKLMGGEPLLHSKIFDILNLIRKKNKKVTIISNITVEENKLKKILIDYNDVVDGWLINSDYPDSHKNTFLNNFKLFYNNNNFSISTTLFPNSESIKKSAYRILEMLDMLNERSGVNIRVSPMSPNGVDNILYDYTMDIINFMNIVWSKGLCKISFDCSINSCEVNPSLIDMFIEHESHIEYKTYPCKGYGPFDILVDNSVIYCASTYNLIKLDNIFDYESIFKAKEAMKMKWKEYWKKYPLNCNFRTCEKHNPVYCFGMCPAKNYIFYKENV